MTNKDKHTKLAEPQEGKWLIRNYKFESALLIITTIITIAAGIKSCLDSAGRGSAASTVVAVGCIALVVQSALLKHRFELQKNLQEQNRKHITSYEQIAQHLKLYVDWISHASTDQRHKLWAYTQTEALKTRLVELTYGRVVIPTHESIEYQVDLVRQARTRIWALHVIIDERDITKIVAEKREFSPLQDAYIAATERKKRNKPDMQRVFIVLKSLMTDTVRLKEAIKKSQEVGFNTRLFAWDAGEVRNQPHLLCIDDTAIVEVKIEDALKRTWAITSHEGAAYSEYEDSQYFRAFRSLIVKPHDDSATLS